MTRAHRARAVRTPGANLRVATILAVTTTCLTVAPASTRADHPTPAPELNRLQATVVKLAAPEFDGRRGPGARRAAEYLAGQLHALGLKPLFGASYFQDFDEDHPHHPGRNIGALLPGSDPVLRDEWIILAAHYDHLGVRDGKLYPGADDNASGVAMLLEVARCLVQQKPEALPRRTVAFLLFDKEEDGLRGSRHFANHPPLPLSELKLFVVADMISRSLGGVCDEFLFAMGSEHAPGLRPWLRASAEPLPIRLAIVGSDLLLFDRSDYGPFRSRKIPYLFFSTGENPAYHTPRDVAETIDYPKLEAGSRIICEVVHQAALADRTPAWATNPEHELDEAHDVRDVLARLLENSEKLAIKPLQIGWLRRQIRDLDDAIARGSMTPLERQRMLLNAQLVIYAIL